MAPANLRVDIKQNISSKQANFTEETTFSEETQRPGTIPSGTDAATLPGREHRRSFAAALPALCHSLAPARHQLGTNPARAPTDSAAGRARRGRVKAGAERPTHRLEPPELRDTTRSSPLRSAGRPGVARETKPYPPSGWPGPMSTVVRAREARHRRRGRGAQGKRRCGQGSRQRCEPVVIPWPGLGRRSDELRR